MRFEEELKQIRETHGEWSAHNISLKDNISTMKIGDGERYKLRANVYIKSIRMGLKKRFSKLSILDLGCLEGGISIELARLGACCTGVDIRESHLVKADFASQVNKLNRKCSWICEDVTSANLWESKKKYDVIILSGLLYHLDAKDILPLLKNIRSALKHESMLIVDTNITSEYLDSYKIDKDLTVWGRTWHEHKANDTIDERVSRAWSSLSNDTAFWLTERSLVNVLVSAGFGYVYKSLYPYHEWAHKNRDIWLAMPLNGNEKEMALRSDPDQRPEEHNGFRKKLT